MITQPIPSDKIPEILRLFGKHCIFYELHSTRGRCILGSKSAYETYFIKEMVPALLMEDKNFSLTQQKFDAMIERIHFYDHGAVLLYENPEIIQIVSYSYDTWKLNHLKSELKLHFPQLKDSSESIYHIKITSTKPDNI